MAKKLVRKALEMLKKLATDGKDDEKEEEEGEDESDEGSSELKTQDSSHPYIKFWEEVRS
jgi:hypothetical protein